MSKHFILCTVILFLLSSVHSQTIERFVIASAGGSFSGNTSLDFTVGETVVSTLNNSNYFLTQGFHQPLPDTIVFINETEDKYQTISIFPNPAKSELNIYIGNIQEEIYEFEILNMLGNLLLQKSFPVSGNQDFIEKIPINFLAQGTYLLRVFNKGSLVGQSKFIRVE